MSCWKKIFKGIRCIYKRLRLKYAVPFLLLFLYTIFGALVLYSTERHHDENIRLNFRQKYKYAQHNLLGRIVEIKADVLIVSEELIQNRSREALEWYNDYLGITGYLKEKSGKSPWTWWGAMFFAGTIYTTIGYGRPAPVTSAGRGFTCFYALFGIPLFLIILKEIGTYLSRLLRHSWRRLVRATRRWRRSFNQWRASKKKTSEAPSTLSTDGKLRQHYPFPIILPLFLVIFWIFFCAALFCLWEREWNYWLSVYFVFVSISTVGLGDVIPSKPDLMLANFLLILIGLCLFSMAFNIIQLRIEEVLEDMLQDFMKDFAKFATVTAQSGPVGIEIGLASGPLTTVPMKTIGRKFSKKWINSHLVQAVGTRRLATQRHRLSSGSSSSSSDDSDADLEKQKHNSALNNINSPPAADELVKRWVHTEQKGTSKALKEILLNRVLENRRLQQLEDDLQQKAPSNSVAIQTDIVGLEPCICRNATSESDTQTLISRSPSLESAANMYADLLLFGWMENEPNPASRWTSACSLKPPRAESEGDTTSLNRSKPYSDHCNNVLALFDGKGSIAEQQRERLLRQVGESERDAIKEFRALLAETKSVIIARGLKGSQGNNGIDDQAPGSK